MNKEEIIAAIDEAGDEIGLEEWIDLLDDLISECQTRRNSAMEDNSRRFRR